MTASALKITDRAANVTGVLTLVVMFVASAPALLSMISAIHLFSA